MSIRVLFFASLADITGMRDVEVDASDHEDVASIYEQFIREFPRLNAYKASVLYAVNSEFASQGSPVHDGDEVAFFPPVSGG